MANRIIPGTVLNPVSMLGYDGSDFRVLLVDAQGRALIVGQLQGSQGLALSQDATGKLNVNANLTGSQGLPFNQTASGYLITAPVFDGSGYRSISGDGFGRLNVLAGWNGFSHQPILIDGDYHLQADVLTSGLPTGAATSANQTTEITSLQKIDDLQNALASVATDKMRVSVVDSALPTGAATSANQSTEITSLQKIDDLQNALDSVGTDALHVRAGYDGATWRALKTDTDAYVIPSHVDKLGNVQGGYYSRYEETGSDTNAPAGNVTKNMTAVAAGYILELENVWAFNNTRAARVQLNRVQNGHTHRIVDINQSAAGFTVYWNGRITMAAGDYVSIVFAGTTAGDALYWGASGRNIRIS